VQTDQMSHQSRHRSFRLRFRERILSSISPTVMVLVLMRDTAFSRVLCACIEGLRLRRASVLCCFIHSDVKLTMGDPNLTTTFNQVGCTGFTRFSGQNSNHTFYATQDRCKCFCGGTCRRPGHVHTTHAERAYRVIICRCASSVLLSQA